MHMAPWSGLVLSGWMQLDPAQTQVSDPLDLVGYVLASKIHGAETDETRIIPELLSEPPSTILHFRDFGKPWLFLDGG